MNKIFRYGLSVWLLGMATLPVASQTLAEAKDFYEKGEYTKAAPAFKRLVKSQPANGNYNLWYGVCCLETGAPQEALKYLQTAVKKRIPSGQLQLGRCYDQLYRFDEALSELEAYRTELIRRKRPTDEVDLILEKCHVHLRMLKGVEKVEVIDSFVVDKQQLIASYRLSDESGKLYTYDQYFGNNGHQGGIVYETELGNRIYFSEEGEEQQSDILVSNKQLDKWSQPTPLPDNINGGQNTDYPFVMTDGQTIYYAADGKNSMGGYDIFVTRYNTANDSYLIPENIGMPFNSPYNDYMFAIDEYNNIGWFASDRYQPEGKVCIYLFIPNAAKRVYDFEHMDRQQLIRLAQLQSIRETWEDEERVSIARQQLAQSQQSSPTDNREVDFVFVVNDRNVYHRLSDFRSQQAQELFHAYRQMEQACKQQDYKLDAMRQRYAAGSQAEKEKLADAIIDMEKNLRELMASTHRKANEVRAIEQQALNKN